MERHLLYRFFQHENDDFMTLLCCSESCEDWTSSKTNTEDKYTGFLYLLQKKHKTDLEKHCPDIWSWISWSWHDICHTLYPIPNFKNNIV